MKKLIFTHISTTTGLVLVVVISAFFGGLFLREARSFVEPGSGPGGSGSYAADLGVIGKPSQGISGTSTLFGGQAALKTAIDGVGGGGGVFTKCQVKHNLLPVYPSCPSGYTDIHSYAMGEIQYHDNVHDGGPHGMTGLHFVNTSDGSWFYGVPGPVTEYFSTLACTVCEK